MEEWKDIKGYVGIVLSKDRVENLEWVTNLENMRHAFKNGLNIPIKERKEYYGNKV